MDWQLVHKQSERFSLMLGSQVFEVFDEVLGVYRFRVDGTMVNAFCFRNSSDYWSVADIQFYLVNREIRVSRRPLPPHNTFFGKVYFVQVKYKGATRFCLVKLLQHFFAVRRMYLPLRVGHKLFLPDLLPSNLILEVKFAKWRHCYPLVRKNPVEAHCAL